jgi:hypothetical protein
MGLISIQLVVGALKTLFFFGDGSSWFGLIAFITKKKKKVSKTSVTLKIELAYIFLHLVQLDSLNE